MAGPAEPSTGPRRTALLVDVLEWFHDEALATNLSRRHWRRLGSRCETAVSQVLDLLAHHGATATFAVLGSIAERQPYLLRRIVASGHEVASLGHEPRDLRSTPLPERAKVLAELARARAAIEAATGVRVHGFRAAWRGEGGEAWWRESLRAEGYDYDASDPGAACFDGLELRSVRVDRFGGGSMVAVRVPVFAFDPAPPMLAGLSKQVLAAHHRAAADVREQLARLVGRAQGASLAEVLQLAQEPAPSRTGPVARPDLERQQRDVPRLAVVVPLKDEEEGLPSLAVELGALRAQLADVAALEFVLVDDGSTDRTWALLQELFGAARHVRLCRHAQNRGVAAAIQTGLRATDAPIAASIDGDLSYDPAELARMLPLLDGADLVTASPYHAAGGVNNVPAWRLLLSRTLSFCYRRLLRSEVRTWTSCFRLYRRASVADLPLDHPGFLGTAEWLVRVLRRGGVVREHPCVLEARLFGASKMKVLRTILGHLRLLWQVLRGRVR